MMGTWRGQENLNHGDSGVVGEEEVVERVSGARRGCDSKQASKYSFSQAITSPEVQSKRWDHSHQRSRVF